MGLAYPTIALARYGAVSKAKAIASVMLAFRAQSGAPARAGRRFVAAGYRVHVCGCAAGRSAAGQVVRCTRLVLMRGRSLRRQARPTDRDQRPSASASLWTEVCKGIGGACVVVVAGDGRRRLIGALRMDRVASKIRGWTLLMVLVLVARGRVACDVSACSGFLAGVVTSLGLAGVKGWDERLGFGER
jgi:hypothetical protein